MPRTALIPLLTLPLAALAEPGAIKANKVDFRRDVLPVLSSRCFHCHGPDEGSREAKLRLDVREDAIKDRSGIQAIVPGNSAKSEVFVRITTDDEDESMPPKKHDKPLTKAEVEVLKKWIDAGAEYDQHWSFVAPKREAVPALPSGMKARNPIDHFIGHALAAAKLEQNPEADRHTLLRRMALDLTGLPPSPQEFAAFEKDNSPDAYEKAVDRMLASPAFGEKWARMWLDLARFADSSGYGSDFVRPFMWPYRDWVISAFNRNMPYDQFTLEQLAGDLLPNATKDQIVATAFHRNTMTQNEGGTSDEEYRVAAVKDRVGTTMQTWMGLTANCAQCHTHKFDPISHKEYYQLFAIFNQTEDADRSDESPKIPVTNKAEEETRAKLQAEIDSIEATIKKGTPEFEEELHSWEARMSRPAEWRPFVTQATKTRGGSLQVLPDGSLRAPEKLAETEEYSITGSFPAGKYTAFQVEVLPEKDGGRVGRANGNAVLTEFLVNRADGKGVPVSGRFVRIEHESGKFLHLAEVQTFSGGKNVAQRGKATQSTTGYGAKADRAIDGKTDGDFDRGSVTHNDNNDKSPWWEVDLGAEQSIEKIVVWNRTGFEDRVVGAKVVLLDKARRPVYSMKIDQPPKPSMEFDPAKGGPIAIAAATATYSQDGFAPAGALDGKAKTGWAFGGATEKSHAAVFELSAPLVVKAGENFTFSLKQEYGGQHHLGRIRISATTAEGNVPALPEAIRNTLALEPSEREPAQREALRNFFRPLSTTVAELQKTGDAKRKELAKVKSVELPIMRERPVDKHRKSHILAKGNYLMPGEEVTGALPTSYGPIPTTKPGTASDRLVLARWIVDPVNPLTSRVAVNRFWAQIFGTGIVETEEDFGTQGQFPSHPELLDWLAVAFKSPKNSDPAQYGFGWDIKALLKLIVTSQTYRQSSRVSEAATKTDARNRWLSHYPRRRLEAEGIRDQALAQSGLLSRKQGGPSVYPPQPDGLWMVAFNGANNSYPTSKGEDRYRRGLYTFWRRIAPNPTMTTFDAPSRETCTIRRVPTNTPLQAFVTMNDPVFVECSQALARRIQTEAKGDVNAKIKWALELVLSRPATDTQIAALRELHDSELLVYRQDAASAQKLATSSELPLPANADAAELAAWTVVANILLNLDGVLMKS